MVLKDFKISKTPQFQSLIGIAKDFKLFKRNSKGFGGIMKFQTITRNSKEFKGI